MTRIGALVALAAPAACTEAPAGACVPAPGAAARGKALHAASGPGAGAVTEGDAGCLLSHDPALTTEAPAGIRGPGGLRVAPSRVHPPAHPGELPGLMIPNVTCTA